MATKEQIDANKKRKGYVKVAEKTAKEVWGGTGVHKNTLEIMHPEVKVRQQPWKESVVLVNSAEDKYRDFMFTLPNEKSSAKGKRASHFQRGFRNPAQRLISTIAEYIYRKPVRRETKSEEIQAFWDNVDNQQTIDDYMRNHAVTSLKGYGTIFTVVDKPNEEFVNKEQERREGMPYATYNHLLSQLF